MLKDKLKKVHWKGVVYAFIIAISTYFIKGFIVGDMPDFLLIGAGTILIVLGFILSILEKIWNIPFLNAIPNWQGAGVLANASYQVGCGVGLVALNVRNLIIISIIAFTLLAIQRTAMSKKASE